MLQSWVLMSHRCQVFCCTFHIGMIVFQCYFCSYIPFLVCNLSVVLFYTFLCGNYHCMFMIMFCSLMIFQFLFIIRLEVTFETFGNMSISMVFTCLESFKFCRAFTTYIDLLWKINVYNFLKSFILD